MATFPVHRICHLERGDVSTDIDSVTAGVRRVRGRALCYRHGEEEGLLAIWVHFLVVRHHSVKQLLQYSITSFPTQIKHFSIIPTIGHRVVTTRPYLRLAS